MTRRIKEVTNANVDHNGIPKPKKKYSRLKPVQDDDYDKSGFCCIYLLVSLGIIGLWSSL